MGKRVVIAGSYVEHCKVGKGREELVQRLIEIVSKNKNLKRRREDGQGLVKVRSKNKLCERGREGR